MKFTVLGMGKTGHAVTCYLLNQGYEVTIWDRSSVKLDTLRDKGIKINGKIDGFFMPKVKANIAEAVACANYIIVMTTSDGHKNIAKLLRGCLQKNQSILIFNGNWGAVEFFQELKEEVREKDIVISETGAQLFAASLKGTGVCALKSIKNHVDVATIPSDKAEAFCKNVSKSFPQFNPAINVIATSMGSVNPLGHCPLNMFNLARVESGEEMLMFASSYTTQLGVNYITKIDEERINVMKAMHC